MRLELILRFGYGAIVPWVTRLEHGALRAIAGPDMVILHTPVHLKGREHDDGRRFHVSAGETVPFVLTYSPSHLDPPHAARRAVGAARDRDLLARMGRQVPRLRAVVARRSCAR